MGDYNKLTKQQIISKINNIAPIANAKLNKVYAGNYQNYNQSFLKKYNIYLNTKVNPAIATKKGMFRKGGLKQYKKSELIHRLEVMEEFTSNIYASAEYTEQHLEELRTKWGISSNDAIKKMFDLYREYGYDNYRDSDGTLKAMSKIVSDAELAGSIDPGEYLESILSQIEDDVAIDREQKEITEDDYIKQLQEHANILK